MGSVHGRLGGDDSNAHLLTDPVSQTEDEEGGVSGKILYRATFDQLEKNYVNYDTVLWILISLLLTLAWGVGILMLLYLPVRRYILQQDVRSRKLYVTSHAIVYKIHEENIKRIIQFAGSLVGQVHTILNSKVSMNVKLFDVTRPAFLPCLGLTTMEKHVLLPLVTDVIIEQGCLQSIYGIHTIRIENLAHGKSMAVDEFQIQGVVNPRLFRKVVLAEASKFGQEAVVYGESGVYNPHKEDSAITDLITRDVQTSRSQSSSQRIPYSPHGNLPGASSFTFGDTLLHKLEEVEHSVKKIEAMVEHSQSLEAFPRSTSQSLH